MSNVECPMINFQVYIPSMTDGHLPIGVGRLVRSVFGIATILFAAIGFLIGNDPRWFAASGALGIIWTLWGWGHDHILRPLSDWMVRGLGDVGQMKVGGLRPTLDDTIRLLESHLRGTASREVQIQAAIRLEEIYRTIRKDPVRAAEVLARVRARYPEAPELERSG